MTRDERLQFEQVAESLRPELRRTAARIAGRSQADDLVQETFLRALQAWTSTHPGRGTRAWFHAILRNTFITDIRRRSREVPLGDDPLIARSLDHALAMDLRRALERLPDKLRETISDVAEGYAYKETATRHATPIGTVMSRVSRARAFLVRLLAA